MMACPFSLHLLFLTLCFVAWWFVSTENRVTKIGTIAVIVLFGSRECRAVGNPWLLRIISMSRSWQMYEIVLPVVGFMRQRHLFLPSTFRRRIIKAKNGTKQQQKRQNLQQMNKKDSSWD
jgi:biotin transporter BioY